jgi:tRNA pseudouridine38-40 synthase
MDRELKNETHEPALRRARLLIAYRGEPFNGFAINPGVPTVAGVMREMIGQITGHRVSLRPAGRTDAGVHGWGQVVSFDLPATVDLVELHKSLNALLEPNIVIRDAQWVADDFDARYSATWREYRYTVLNTPYADPFLTRTAWHVSAPLDLRAMQLASDAFVGQHDFTSFCRRPKQSGSNRHSTAPSMLRDVTLARWSDAGEGVLQFDIRANAFCQQMVRAIVGTLVEVGLGRRKAGEMLGILRGGNRTLAGQIAPPHGLCLMEVGYS